MKEYTEWSAKFTRGYNDIPLFSEPYKIKVCGIYGTYDGMYEATNLFLKSHGQKYLLNLDNNTKIVSLTPIDLEYYLRNIDNKRKILPIHDKLLNPKNECGVMITDILRYDDEVYEYNKEIGHEYLFGQKLTKKEFMTEFFDEKEVEEFKLGVLDALADIEIPEHCTKNPSPDDEFDDLIRNMHLTMIGEIPTWNAEGEDDINLLKPIEMPYTPMRLDDILKEMVKSVEDLKDKSMDRRTSIIEDRTDDDNR